MNPVWDAEAVFVALPSVFSRLSRLADDKAGLASEVGRSLRWCVKGIERGATKGFIGDTKLGHLCQDGDVKGAKLQPLEK